MGISNTKNNFYFLLFIFLLVSCNEEGKKKKCLALYHFTEEIVFDDYTSKEIESAKIFFKRGENSLKGEILFDKKEEHTTSGQIQFQSVVDTICKKDTIHILIAERRHFITEIIQRYADVSLGSNRPAFIEYKIDGIQFRSGTGVLKKNIKNINKNHE